MAVRGCNVITAFLVLHLSSILCTYWMTVGSNHAEAFVPSLGLLGDRPVESTVFTQLFVVVAAALAAVVQVHHVSVCALLEKNEASQGQRLANTAALYVGYLAASGLFVLACFQERHAYYVHRIAEAFYLLGSVIYCGLHAFISLKDFDARSKCRLAMTAVMAVAFVMFLVALGFAVRDLGKEWEQRHHLGQDDGGWLPHVLCASSEWVIIGVFQFYLLTCYSDVRCTRLTKTSIVASLDGL